MIQTPMVNPYMQQPIPAPSYNAVKIDVHNPMVNPPCVPQQTAAMSSPQLYSYPQAQLYQYPQASTQPYYMPIQQPCPPCPPCEQAAAPAPVQAPVVTPVAVPVVTAPAQQNINVPEPVVTKPAQPADAQPVQVTPPQTVTPQVDINSFIAKLSNPDYEVQAAAMEEIANLINTNPKQASELLDEKIVNALTGIINADSSKLEGPSPEQVAARDKLLKGQQLNENEKKLAATITPMEQAERNKCYAMFTTAIMQKLFADEVKTLTNTTVPLTELPGAISVVEQLKNNPNPMVRTSAIDAMSYIQKPEYKKDLETLFTIAKNDQDKNVQDAADAALKKLSQLN